MVSKKYAEHTTKSNEKRNKTKNIKKQMLGDKESKVVIKKEIKKEWKSRK